MYLYIEYVQVECIDKGYSDARKEALRYIAVACFLTCSLIRSRLSSSLARSFSIYVHAYVTVRFALSLALGSRVLKLALDSPVFSLIYKHL